MVIFILMFAALSTMVAAASLALIIAMSMPWRPLVGVRANASANGQVLSHERGWNECRQVPPAGAILTETDRDGFLKVWHSVRSRFASDPRTAVCYADLLMSDILGERAIENSAVSGLDPETAERYRKAHEIASRNRRQQSNPEELALAMSLYAAVLDEALSAEGRKLGTDN